MNILMWILIGLPFLGSGVLIMGGARLPKRLVSLVGSGSVGLAALITLYTAVSFLSTLAGQESISAPLFSWIVVANVKVQFSLYFDTLSLVMGLVITIVSFFILLYSSDFMKGEQNYHRFFAYMDLFVGFMLVLILSDNLPFLYIGWEGVGLCSYLLIGFWYRDPANDTAARKAFIVTRVGDTALLVGILLLFTRLGTFDIQELMSRSASTWETGSGIAVAGAVLVLVGALSKSAQVPLQVWLPDAMAGPTPVSALIHSSTMVTAGVYLIARTHGLFEMAPAVLMSVAVIGAITLVLSGFSGLNQDDIKVVLAYSTISQIGYMFLALGVGAWPAAIFHFATHAFFKALLFLATGVLVLSLHHERRISRMGGMRTQFPAVFWTFLIGAASLSAVPVVTAGFYSKDWILREVWASPRGGSWLWLAGVVGVVLTTLYTFRLVFLVFFGEQKTKTDYTPGFRMMVPLFVFALFSLGFGMLQVPPLMGRISLMNRILETAIPGYSLPGSRAAASGQHVELLLLLIPSAATVVSIFIAYLIYLRKPIPKPEAWSQPLASLRRFFHAGWGFDRMYDAIFIRPFLFMSRRNRDDRINLFYTGIAGVNRGMHTVLSLTQSGKLRWYAFGIGIGVVISIWIVVIL
jgi:NADH-quinone oxidoreductase subunit L